MLIAFVAPGTPFPGVLDSILWLWVAVGFVSGLVLLVLRLRNPDDRRRLAPIVVGTIVGVTPLLLLNALPDVIGHILILPAGVAALGLVGIPIGFTYAILRHRLFALDALVRRLLLRVVDVVAFVAAFDLIWLPLRRVGVDSEVAGIIAVIGVALTAPSFGPWIHDQIDRALYGSLFEARRRALLGEQRAVREIGLALIRQVRQLVPVQWVALIGQGAALGPRPVGDDAPPAVLLASDGDVPAQGLRGRWVDHRLIWTGGARDEAVTPIVSGDRTLCALVVGHRLNDAPLNGLDRETIQLLARPAAAPIEAAMLREAAEDERRFRDGLSSFARGLATAGSVEQVLQVTAAQTRQLLRADVGLTWLRGPDGELTLVATDGENAAEYGPARPPGGSDRGESGLPATVDSSSVVRERHVAGGPRETFSRITYQLGDVGSGIAIGVVVRLGEDQPFGQEDERRAEEIAEHADGAFRRAHAIAQAAEAETLRQITKVRSEFLDVVSHDLQNPLTVIRGFAELLEMRLGASNDSYVNNSLNSIVEATTTCQRLIDDLLTSARIERGRLSLNREAIDAEKFLIRLANAYQVLPDGHRIRVDTATSVAVWADAARLEQMIGNLVTNALRYAENGPITLRARVLSQLEGCIEVRDQGKGIAPEDQSRIWDRFYRTASGQLRTTKGAGVGLSVVRTLAELHGGRAEVESVLGQGSIFRVVLPIADDFSDETATVLGSRGSDQIVTIQR
ncbi:MAG: sensor histidine kinase [Chloroflexota bacterium]